MENLTASVYECSFPVEAHMICDLLARAGISSRVDGEFLAGAGGELPMGNSIRVRVEPSRISEARLVIDEWERLQPVEPTAPPPTPRKSNWQSSLWFLCGLVVGGTLMFLALRTPYTSDSADTDGDGMVDERYYYSGNVLARIDYDRDADRKIDARWISDRNGVAVRLETDDDFDGRFEWTGEARRGWLVREVQDANDDGRPEQVLLFRHGVLHTIEIYDEAANRVVVREHIDNARLVAREVDQDGDGVFEKRVDFDGLGEPVSR